MVWMARTRRTGGAVAEKERVLVVDDDPSVLSMIGVALSQSGFDVETAKNGFIALDLITNGKPFSVILVDLMMPDITGQDLARRVRLVDPDLEIVIITAAPALDSAVRTLRAGGAYDYLVKPFESINQLALTVERAAGHRRLKMERESLYQRIQAEAEWLQALIADTTDGIISVRGDGIISVANPAAAHLMGNANLVGQPYQACLPSRLAELITNWQEVAAPAQPARHHPSMVEMPWLDGSIQLVTLTPVTDSIGRKGWVALLRDITHLKQLDEIKTQMLIEAAYKIRQPLSQAVNSLAELNQLAAQNVKVGAVLLKLGKLWERIQEWVDDMVALVKISSEQDIKIQALDVTAILHEIRNKADAKKLAEKNVQLEVDIEGDLPWVHTDPVLLMRLLKGLLSRAVMRSSPGGKISLYARQRKGQVWIDVSDEGPAIKEDQVPYIFGVTALKSNSEAGYTGMELAIAKTIMERIGGQVWVGNESPRGSVITICLH